MFGRLRGHRDGHHGHDRPASEAMCLLLCSGGSGGAGGRAKGIVGEGEKEEEEEEEEGDDV